MTVYDFMKKFGDYETFNIYVENKAVTSGGEVCLADIRQPYYDNENVLNSLELNAVKYDIEQNILYAER